MKVYLAARYSRRDEMRGVAAEARRLGHAVTSRWLDTDWLAEGQVRSIAAPPEYREKYALIDHEDVQAADLVANFTEPPGSGGRGGRHVEFGLAVAWGKRLVVVGHRENLFHHLPAVVFCPDAEALLALLRDEAAPPPAPAGRVEVYDDDDESGPG